MKGVRAWAGVLYAHVTGGVGQQRRLAVGCEGGGNGVLGPYAVELF